MAAKVAGRDLDLRASYLLHCCHVVSGSGSHFSPSALTAAMIMPFALKQDLWGHPVNTLKTGATSGAAQSMRDYGSSGAAASVEPGPKVPLFGHLPKRARVISAAEAFEMHKRRIQEGFEPKKAATRTTYVAMAVQVCFLVLLLAIIYGLRKADDDGLMPGSTDPLLGGQAHAVKGGRNGRAKLYSKASEDATKAWVLVGGTTDTNKQDLIGKTAALHVVKMDAADKKLDYVNEAPHDSTSSTKAAMHLSRSSQHPSVFYMSDNSLPGEVIAFKLDTDSGSLSVLSKVKSKGDKTVQTVVDASAQWLLAISTESRLLEVFSLGSDGSLTGTTAHREHFKQEPTAVYTGPSGTGVYVLFEQTSQIMLFTLDATTGKLSAGRTMTLSSDAKASRMAFSSNGRYAYVLQKDRASVATLLVRPDTSLVFSTQRQAVPIVPQEVVADIEAGSKTAEALELQMDSAGRVMVASAKVTDVASGESTGYVSVLHVRADSRRGALIEAGSTVQAGTEPRSLSLSSDGSHLVVVDADAADGADNLLLFDLDSSKATASRLVSASVPSRPRSAVLIPIASKA